MVANWTIWTIWFDFGLICVKNIPLDDDSVLFTY